MAQSVAGCDKGGVDRSEISMSGDGAPRDRRSRAVIEARRLPSGATELRLECGHVLRRKLKFCQPSRVICTLCPHG